VAAVVRRSRLDEAALGGLVEQRLVHYQQPRRGFVESLPRNSLGKVLRRELRDLFS
jgi:acyl-coenzyme A synthetase/AMP-(fatty) acid ligase